MLLHMSSLLDLKKTRSRLAKHALATVIASTLVSLPSTRKCQPSANTVCEEQISQYF